MIRSLRGAVDISIVNGCIDRDRGGAFRAPRFFGFVKLAIVSDTRREVEVRRCMNYDGL